jgi:hypothetical protein
MDLQPAGKQMKNLLLVSLIVGATAAFGNLWLVNENRKLMQRLKAAVAKAEHASGFEVARDVFSRDGKSYAGCVRSGRTPESSGGMIDRIEPGESVGIAVPLELPRRPDSPSVRQ